MGVSIEVTFFWQTRQVSVNAFQPQVELLDMGNLWQIKAWIGLCVYKQRVPKAGDVMREAELPHALSGVLDLNVSTFVEGVDEGTQRQGASVAGEDNRMCEGKLKILRRLDRDGSSPYVRRRRQRAVLIAVENKRFP